MRKRLFTLCTMTAMLTTFAMGQEEAATKLSDGSWSTLSTPALKSNMFIFDNWAKTGNSQIDVTSTFFGNYKYTHPKFVWDNVVDLAYGYAWQDLDNSTADSVGGFFETRRKSNDKIDLTSVISWNAYKGWGASFTANLKTQFGTGYEYSGLGVNQTFTEVSRFFAPAYLTTALSFEHKRETWSVSLSFLTGKTTFVVNDSLIARGYNYGVIQTDPENKFTHAYFGLGSYVRLQYLKKDILPKLDLYARLELFYDYRKPKNMSWDNIATFVSDPTDPDKKPTGCEYTLTEGETWEELGNYGWLKKRAFESDLDFEFKLDYRFSEHIAANLALNMKWDTDFNGMGHWGHWQVYQMAGVQVFFSWKTPKQ